MLLKLKRWVFSKEHLDYVKHVFQLVKLTILTKATDAIYPLQHRTNITELKSFLGTSNEFQRSVANFGGLAVLQYCNLEMYQPSRVG